MIQFDDPDVAARYAEAVYLEEHGDAEAIKVFIARHYHPEAIAPDRRNPFTPEFIAECERRSVEDWERAKRLSSRWGLLAMRVEAVACGVMRRVKGWWMLRWKFR